MKNLLSLFLFLSISALTIEAQDTPTTDNGITSGAVNVFIDGCWNCNFDNFKREVKYVNFMRTRQEADVFILVTGQDVGSGGEKFTLYFEGQQSPYQTMKDTLSLITENDDTDRVISDKILIQFKKGIIPYVLKSEIANEISFSYKSNSTNESTSIAEEDPWNNWVFSVSTRGNLNGESSSDGLSFSGRISANRVTEENKISIRAGFRYRENNFHLIDYDSVGVEISRETFTSLRRSQYGTAEYVKSLTTHWSAAATLNVNANTFSNLDLSTKLKLGVEYNYFPYSESDRRALTFVYKVGPTYNDYVDSTIYDKTSELLWQHSFSIDLAQKQKWGSVFLGVSYNGYLHDFDLYSIAFNPNIDWNITKGLTLGIGGYASIIGDQITLPKENVDVPDLLLQNRIIATKFSYWGYFSIRYSFGSKYNNVVNPRYEGGGGGSFFFF